VIASHEQQPHFDINYPQEPGDPMELRNPRGTAVVYSFGCPLSLVAIYTRLESGELVRYTAMLVPPPICKEGIQYNPEALEIFFDAEALVLTDWMQQLEYLSHRG